VSRAAALRASIAAAGAGLALAIAPAQAAGPAPAAVDTAGQAGKPKLAVSEVGNAPRTAAGGNRFKVSGRVVNRGRRSGRSPVKLIALDEGSDRKGVGLGSRSMKRIKPGNERKFRVKAKVRSKLAAGAPMEGIEYRLAACVRRHGAGSKFRCRTLDRPLTVLPDVPAPPGFEPGARSIGDPLFPQVGNGGYDAAHYAIELDYDPLANRFGAGTSTVMRAVATQDLSELSLDFQRDLEITSVKVDGTESPYERRDATPQLSNSPAVTQPAKLIVTPPGGIASGSEFTIAVRYRGEPEEITDPDESIEGWIRACLNVSTETGCDGAFVVNEPNGAQSWFPSNNHPSDKATVETAITVPNLYTALGVGELDSEESNGDGTSTWSWSEDDPTATYLTTATVGLFDYQTASMTEDSTGAELPIYKAIDQAVPAAAVNTTLDRIPEMTNFLSDTYGAYPFDSTGAVVDNVPDVGYALEVQTKPHFALPPVGASGSSTLLHELAHMWWGNSVSPSSWLEIWHNEGWAQFSEWWWDFEANGGSTSPEQQFQQEYDDASEEDWSIAPATLGGDPANLFAFFPTYIRGAMTLEGYREIVGDAKFFAFADELLASHGYADVSTAEIIAAAEDASGFSGAQLTLLGEYFQQWLYGTVKPDILPEDFAP
jgi:aminopeptidase N